VSTKFQAEIAELTDKILLDWLTNGKKDYLQDGREIVRQLTAAEMTVVLKRLAQLGISAVPTKGSTAGNLVEAAQANLSGTFKFQGRPLPPVDTKNDDKATKKIG
jgi:hypothetical protein